MLDEGIKEADIPLELQYLQSSTDIFTIIYTDNIGPHRKLLPILQHYWNTDCAIITLDDDNIVHKDALFQLVSLYIDHNKESIVGLRTRRLGFCQDNNVKTTANPKQRMLTQSHPAQKNSTHTHTHTHVNQKVLEKAKLETRKASSLSVASTKGRNSKDIKEIDESAMSSVLMNFNASLKLMDYDFCLWPQIKNGKKEFLSLPTGSGGVIYRPRFFHKIVFDPILIGLTKYNDDLTFRLGTMANNISIINSGDNAADRCDKTGTKLRGYNSKSIPPPIDEYSHVRKYLCDRNQEFHRHQMQIHSQSEMKSVENHFLNKVHNLIDIHYLNKSSLNAETASTSAVAKKGPVLYSKNVYWNTDMWTSGVGYLKIKNIIDVNQYYDLNFLLSDRSECYLSPDNKNPKNRELRGLKTDIELELITNINNDGVSKLVSSTNTNSYKYDMNNRRVCGFIPSCVGMHY